MKAEIFFPEFGQIEPCSKTFILRFFTLIQIEFLFTLTLNAKINHSTFAARSLPRSLSVHFTFILRSLYVHSTFTLRPLTFAPHPPHHLSLRALIPTLDQAR